MEFNQGSKNKYNSYNHLIFWQVTQYMSWEKRQSLKQLFLTKLDVHMWKTKKSLCLILYKNWYKIH
jgi:hypothetical protein